MGAAVRPIVYGESFNTAGRRPFFLYFLVFYISHHMRRAKFQKLPREGGLSILETFQRGSFKKVDCLGRGYVSCGADREKFSINKNLILGAGQQIKFK